MFTHLTKKLLTFLTLTASCLTWGAPTTVFFLGSGTSHSPWNTAFEKGLTQTLDQSQLPIVYYADHLDVGRFNEVILGDAMFRYLQTKFDNKHPDLFIAAGPAAAEFSLSYPDLFPASKRILIQPNIELQDNLNNVLVINTKVNYSLMVKEAIRLSNPDQIYVIGNSANPSDQLRLNSSTKQLDIAALPYRTLENLDLDSLVEQVAEIKSDNAIFFTPTYRQYKGKSLYPTQVLEKLHEVTNAPIFATSTTAIGAGAVGGHLHSPIELGIMAGEASVNVIKQQPIEFSVDGFEVVYDWNEIVRWGYRDKISPGSQIRFKPQPIWINHQKEATLIASFLSILIALLLALTIYNRKLTKAKAALSQQRELLEKKVAERTQELSTLYQQAEKRARVDELTGISNRREFFELGELIHNQTTRTLSPYTIVMIDIDSFKRVNDNFGHAVGDKVIRSITTSITSVTRKSDVVARIGGEEFALILTNTRYDQVQSLTERIRATVENNHVKSKQQVIATTVSIGVAEYQPQDSHIGVVLARADKALYQAKETGKNKVVFC